MFAFKYNNDENKHLCFNARVAFIIYQKIAEMPNNQHIYTSLPFSEDALILLKEQCKMALEKAIKEKKYENPDYLMRLYYYNYNTTKVINEDFIRHIAEKVAETEFVLQHLIEYDGYNKLSKETIEKVFGDYERFEKFLNEEIEETAFVKA